MENETNSHLKIHKDVFPKSIKPKQEWTEGYLLFNRNSNNREGEFWSNGKVLFTFEFPDIIAQTHLLIRYRMAVHVGIKNGVKVSNICEMTFFFNFKK